MRMQTKPTRSYWAHASGQQARIGTSRHIADIALPIWRFKESEPKRYVAAHDLVG
jgi:hypothetical protein